MNEQEYQRRNALANGIRTGEFEVDEDSARTYMNRVYGWMTVALAITGVTCWLVFQHMSANMPVPTQTGDLVGGSIFWNSSFRMVTIFAQLGLVIYFSIRLAKMSQASAIFCFLGYAVLTGITLAPIFLCYTESSLELTFFATAGTFAAVSLYGYLTKSDLTSVGSFCMMGLFGIIIASLLNFFFQSEGLDQFITYAGVFIFIGLTAWDTQKLKKFGSFIGSEEDGIVTTGEAQKFAIFGALQLYLDFINLFLYLLRIFGNRGRR